MSETPLQYHGVNGVHQKDTTYTKIFVGGLPYHTTDKSLRQFFQAFGEIEEAVVITDRQTGKSRGYGFVTMGDKEAAERAVSDANPIIDGRKANVNLAYLGARPRTSTASGFSIAFMTNNSSLLPRQLSFPAQYVYVTPPGVVVSPLSPPATSHFYDHPGAYSTQYANGLDPLYSISVGTTTPPTGHGAYAYHLAQPAHPFLQHQAQEARMQ